MEVEARSFQIIKLRIDPLGRGEYNYSVKQNTIFLEALGNNEELLKEKALNQPTKIQQREMNGYYMEVYVHTYFYYGGVALLYVNRTKSKTYVEDLQLDLVNLDSDDFENGIPSRLEIPPRESLLINLK